MNILIKILSSIKEDVIKKQKCFKKKLKIKKEEKGK